MSYNILREDSKNKSMSEILEESDDNSKTNLLITLGDEIDIRESGPHDNINPTDTSRHQSLTSIDSSKSYAVSKLMIYLIDLFWFLFNLAITNKQ